MSISFSTVREADLDLILLQRLACSERFRQWFLTKVSSGLGDVEAPGDWNFARDVHRNGEYSGQSDLIITFDSGAPSRRGRRALFIENKIDAQFSDRTFAGSQMDRYRGERDARIADNTYSAAVVVLVAPAAYGLSGADTHVSVEDWLAWEQAGTSADVGEANLCEFYGMFLEAVLGRHKRGWTRTADTQMSAVWRYYGNIARTTAADLKMKYQDNPPADSYTVPFFCLPMIDGLPKCRIEHVMKRGTIDIFLPRSVSQLARVEVAFRSTLPEDCRLRAASGSLAIGFDRLPIKTSCEPSTQHDRFVAALRDVRTLKVWFERHAAALAEIIRTSGSV